MEPHFSQREEIAMFDPLEHQGLPPDSFERHWHELDAEPARAGAADPLTQQRISAMQTLQLSTVTFDEQLSQRCPDLETHRSVGRLGALAAEHHHDLAARQPTGAMALPGEQTHLAPKGVSDWEQLVAHESAICHLYYSYLQQETDPKVRPLWELHLQMELAQLQVAGNLLRRFEDRDPHEVTALGLPEIPSGTTVAGNGWHDLVDLMTQQHTQIAGLFERVHEGAGDSRHTAFGDLARLMAAHEVVEEEVVHPLARHLDPEDPLVARLLEEERRISEALADAVRAHASNSRAEMSGALRVMVRSHARHEEHEEFSRVREAVPPAESRHLARAVWAAQEAAPVGEATVPQTADRMRDALRELSREMSARPVGVW
jgi:hypothetical protein